MPRPAPKVSDQPDQDSGTSQHDRRSQAMRARICRAAIACLDRYGYAETSFARVQEKAGVSRGAITHHFPSKQALVAATALVLLSKALEPARNRDSSDAPMPVHALILASWDSVVNSAGGRAMVEILSACRSDRALHALLADKLHDWDRQSRRSITRHYVGTDAEDAELLWSIARSFLRGLILHEQFTADPAYLGRMVERFARMMETQLHLRPPG
ncbi:TetR/AcrR family transcriptional regulator [Pseudodonghicola flavimaris]|uniref:TetR/AcrR family transcriptional regulator n=1 Tax=Pseudodonghicola flavimaris TaxID=3050036 RepID=A0ABT7F6N0_9RHOB|nr:TetR/AcrR family transcriptional regulator [Pseudodonghicola flavimaris]MDK3020165.1 TetR/AcrR family transcriptional regulator [Pseudodonghicola flavimaris]